MAMIKGKDGVTIDNVDFKAPTAIGISGHKSRTSNTMGRCLIFE